ncbi:hypothetical protein [[Actinomadura] parvosata]|uniref:hypothetical protein n=1 Tax=[Actinomadura] parvosata TaxID=1955412 RepID=UPI0016484183|nr:hypothetical protein [Nonomuraea sp. ATCC 55076]
MLRTSGSSATLSWRLAALIAGGDDLAGVLGLCVQGVGGDDHRGQVQAAQQGCEGGDLVALGLDLPLGEYDLGVMPDGGRQVSDAVAGAAAAQSLAVHGQAEQGCFGGRGRRGGRF